jgi:hypothetical protein
MDVHRSDDVEAVKQALVKLMAIADRLDVRNTQAVQRIDAAVTALDQGVQRLAGGGERFANEALQVIGTRTQQAIVQGAGQAMDGFQQQLQQGAEAATWAAQEMDTQRKGLAAARRSLVWNGLLALLVGSLLAAGGTGFFAWKSMQAIAQAQFGQDILQATRSGTLSHCGDSLCLKVGKKPRRYGKDGEYALLQE